MFKKTLVAAALATAGLTSAFAGEITIVGDSFTVGNEYLAAYTGSGLEGDLNQAEIAITYNAGIALGIDNTLKFVFDGGTIVADTGLILQATGSVDAAVAAADVAVNAVIEVLPVDDSALAIIAAAEANRDALEAAALAALAAQESAETIDSTGAEAAVKAAALTIDVTDTFENMVNIISTAYHVTAQPVSLTIDVADLVDFLPNVDTGNYEETLFKLTGPTLVSDVLTFNDTNADTFSNVAVSFTKETIGAGNVTVAMPEAKDGTGADLIAPQATAKILVTTQNQFAIELETAHDVIDVEQDRKFFVQSPAALGATVTQAFDFDVTITPVSLGIDPVAATYTYRLDDAQAFSGIASIVDSEAGAYLAGGSLTATNIKDSTTVITVNGTTALDTRSIKINMEINPVEDDTNNFFLRGAENTFTDTAFDWTLNGSQVDIPYMPYGDTVSQIMYVVNSGTQQPGAITVDAWLEDGTPILENAYVHDTVTLGTRKITAEVKALLEDEGFTKGKVRFKIISKAPSNDIEVYSAYNVGGSDRGLVINSSNKTDVDTVATVIADLEAAVSDVQGTVDSIETKVDLINP